MKPSLPSLSARIAPVLIALSVAGCSSLRPPAQADLPPVQPDIPQRLPVDTGTAPATGESTAPMDWPALLADARSQNLVRQALAHNRDLRVAALTVQRAQAQLAAAEAARWPLLGVGLGASRAPNSQGNETSLLTAGVSMPSWEVDLFGRLQNLSDAARAQFLASQAGQRAAELALVAQVVQAILAWQADTELLSLAQRTLASRDDSLRLVTLREQAGAASLLELQAQRSLVAQARATLAQAQRSQAMDRNALTLLLGQPVADDALPQAPLAMQTLAEVPVGLDSQVLLRRPDVLQAEQLLRAAQANIAAARAAFWPSITLTAQAGQASAQLSGLFQGGNFAYTLAANALLTVFDAGRRQANVDGAVAQQQVAVAQLERVVQAAFRDTADALAGLSTWRAQLAAQDEQVQAAREIQRLVALRHRQGAASDLERLNAERALLAAEQGLLQVRLAELNNRVGLFKALGGGVSAPAGR